MLMLGGCSVSDLSTQRGGELPLAASPGRSPSEKAEGHGETHASQKDCRLQRAASSAPQKPWLSVLTNENRIPEKTKKEKKKKHTHTHTLKPWRLLMRITICCWRRLLIQNPAEHFKSCMWAQRWTWANVIWSDKMPPVFQCNRYAVSQLF